MSIKQDFVQFLLYCRSSMARPEQEPHSMPSVKAAELQKWLASDTYAAVLAPWLEDDTFAPNDGYLQRIRFMDGALFAQRRRIYLYNSPFWTSHAPGFYQPCDPKVFYVIYNDSWKSQRRLVYSILKNARLCYIHSVYRLNSSVSSPFGKFYVEPESVPCPKLLDLHGLISAELEMNGSDEKQIQLARQSENTWVAAADLSIAVSRRMLTCFDAVPRQQLIIPIFDREAVRQSALHQRIPSEKPIVLYSGGLQAWQNIDEMIETTEHCIGQYDFRFYVNDPQQLRKTLDNHHPSKTYVLDRLTTHQLNAAYDRADFGLILRDDSPVNYVACPTKLIEYLIHGVIPIMKSTQVGDFTDLGMQYITQQDFIAGNLPDFAQQQRMREQNITVVKKLSQDVETNLTKLRQQVDSCFS